MYLRQLRSRVYLALFLTGILITAPITGRTQDSNPGQAKPVEAQSYRSGLKSIVIPSPTAELNEIGPDYRVLLDSFVPDTNRLLAAFVNAETSANVRAGVSKPFYQYAMVETLRRAEFAEVDPALFKQASEGVAQEFGAYLSSQTHDWQDEVNRKLKAMRGMDAKASVSKPIQLGTFFSKPNACGFGMISDTSFAGNTAKLVAAMTVLRVQNRLIFAYFYSAYKDEDSVQWVRKTSEQWADAILKANAN